jgi:hypothetical protein
VIWQPVPSALVQHIVKFLTNKIMNPARILEGLRAQFSDEMLSRTQVYDWSKSLKED